MRLDLREQPLEFALGNVALFGMPRLAFAPIEGDQLARKQVELLAPECEGAADLPHRLAIVASELGYRLVVGSELLQQPQQFDIAMRLLLQATAGAQAIERAIKVELQEIARMIRRASCGRRCDALEAERCKIKFIDEGIDEADRVLFCDIVIETLRKEDLFVTVRALDMPHNSTKLQERGIAIGCVRLYRIVEF